MRRFPCPYLGGFVELSEERESHILERHPDLLPQWITELAEAIEDPDDVIPVFPGEEHLFVRWFGRIRGGRYIVVAVVTDDEDPSRHWIVTAYLSRRAPGEM